MTRTISNPERGCGTLKRGKGYVRGVIGSPNGILPSFVRCDPFIPFREVGTDGEFTRSFLELNGVGFEAAAQDDVTDFVPCYPGDTEHDFAVENMVDRGLYDDEDQVPDAEPQRHFDRIRAKAGLGAEHFGEFDIAQSNDLLMRAGKTHYPDPDDYIQETIEMGISKAIPLSKRQEPPVIEPGLTRIWIVHPDTDVGWAIIGFAYVQEVVFTEPADGNVPQYVQDWNRQGRLDVVDIEPAPDDDDGPDASIDDYQNGDRPEQDDQQDDRPVERRDPFDLDPSDAAEPDEPGADPGGQADEDGIDDADSDPVFVGPSDKPNQDVEPLPIDDDLADDLGAEFTYNDLKAIAGHLDLGDELGPHPSGDVLTARLSASVDDVDEAKRYLNAAVTGDDRGDADA